MKSNFATALEGLGVFNTHGILSKFGEKGKDVCVSFKGRDRWHAAMSVAWSPSFPISAEAAAWPGQGGKTFHGTREESLGPAQNWAGEKYGIEVWAASPVGHGDYVPADVVKRAKAAVKTNIITKESEE